MRAAEALDVGQHPPAQAADRPGRTGRRPGPPPTAPSWRGPAPPAPASSRFARRGRRSSTTLTSIRHFFFTGPPSPASGVPCRPSGKTRRVARRSCPVERDNARRASGGSATVRSTLSPGRTTASNNPDRPSLRYSSFSFSSVQPSVDAGVGAGLHDPRLDRRIGAADAKAERLAGRRVQRPVVRFQHRDVAAALAGTVFIHRPIGENGPTNGELLGRQPFLIEIEKAVDLAGRPTARWPKRRLSCRRASANPTSVCSSRATVEAMPVRSMPRWQWIRIGIVAAVQRLDEPAHGVNGRQTAGGETQVFLANVELAGGEAFLLIPRLRVGAAAQIEQGANLILAARLFSDRRVKPGAAVNCAGRDDVNIRAEKHVQDFDASRRRRSRRRNLGGRRKAAKTGKRGGRGRSGLQA